MIYENPYQANINWNLWYPLCFQLMSPFFALPRSPKRLKSLWQRQWRRRYVTGILFLLHESPPIRAYSSDCFFKKLLLKERFLIEQTFFFILKDVQPWLCNAVKVTASAWRYKIEPASAVSGHKRVKSHLCSLCTAVSWGLAFYNLNTQDSLSFFPLESSLPFFFNIFICRRA